MSLHSRRPGQPWQRSSRCLRHHIHVMTGGNGKSAPSSVLQNRFRSVHLVRLQPHTQFTNRGRESVRRQDSDLLVRPHRGVVNLSRCRADWPYGEIPFVAIVAFGQGKLAHENVQWDPSGLKQISLLIDDNLHSRRRDRAQGPQAANLRKEVT